jgi:hypothetical protein
MSNPPPSRNLWPASIIGFFSVAVLFLGSFVVWAMRQHEDLVSADYYEREVRYQQQLDSMNRSQEVATKVVVTFDPAQQAILISLPAAKGARGRVHLYRPSDARLDRELPLSLNQEGVQRLDATGLSGGLWKVRVKWTTEGQEYFLDQPVIVTGAPGSVSAS